MKNNNLNSRRTFLGSLALGAAASSVALLTNCENATDTSTTTTPEPEKIHEADEWFKGIKGKHRIVYDGPEPHAGFPIIWNWAFYLSNNETGSPDEDITAMTVLRHNALPLAFEHKMWEKYPLGEVFGIKTSAGEPYKRNPYYEPQAGDYPLDGPDGIKRMQERGAMFCVCDLAAKVYSNIVAQQMGLDSTEVYNDWISGVLPGIQIVPSGVWALGRAQENGCGYIYAGG